VLVNERPALIGVALQARFLIAICLIDHSRSRSHAPSRIEGSMRVVAIGALDHAFIDAVFIRHGELGANGRVAGVAKLCLLLGQQESRRRRFVNRVTRRADHVLLGMHAPANIRASKGLSVTAEAGVENPFRREFRKCDDRRFGAARLQVRAPRAVAAFASGIFGLVFSGREAHRVWIPIKVPPDVGVAGAADLGPNKTVSQQAQWGYREERRCPRNKRHHAHYTGESPVDSNTNRKKYSNFTILSLLPDKS